MNVTELIEIALANADDRRVEVVALEPADVATEAVSGLAQLVSELVDNALAFSEPDDPVRVTGLYDGDDYMISVSDAGVGISEHFIDALNRALEDPKVHIGGPEPRLGIQLVARLAARHGVLVRLVPAMPGTTARAIVPARLVTRLGTHGGDQSVFVGSQPMASDFALAGFPRAVPRGVGRTIDLTKYESPTPADNLTSSHDPTATADVEEFLETVFAPLIGQPAVGPATGRPVDGPAVRSRPPGPQTPWRARESALRVRVPGENFSVAEDEPSTVPGEGAVDIRKALSSFDSGRRSATESPIDS